MSQATISFEVKGDKGTTASWIAVDDRDVTLNNGKGSIVVNRPAEHILFWWFTGNEGSTLSIVARSPGQTSVEVKESKIPAGQTKAGGLRRFALL